MGIETISITGIQISFHKEKYCSVDFKEDNEETLDEFIPVIFCYK